MQKGLEYLSHSVLFLKSLGACLIFFLLDYKLLEKKWIVLFLTFSVIVIGANASVD